MSGILVLISTQPWKKNSQKLKLKLCYYAPSQKLSGGDTASTWVVKHWEHSGDARGPR